MSSFSMDFLKVSLLGDKKEIIDILNIVMKNRGMFSVLTVEDTFEQMIEVINTLSSSCLKREDFFERPYYDYPDFQLSDGVITQQEYDDWVNELSKKRDWDDIHIENLVIQSNGDCLLKLLDRTSKNSDPYTWEDIINELYSIKGCVIDNITMDDYKGYFISEYRNYTKIIKKNNENLHIDIYPSKNYDDLMDGDIYPLHFGLMIYEEFLNSVEWCNFLLEEVSPKPEGDELEKLLKEKSEKESILNSHKEKLSLMSGIKMVII